MKGKNRCKILKEIRRRIAEENNIEYITSDCKYKGDCLGTCPKCESEVAYLERELERRRSLGYKVTVAGLAAGITLSSVGCTPDTVKNNGSETLMGDYPAQSSVSSQIVGDESSDGELIVSATVGDLAEDDSSLLSDYSETSDESEVELIGELPDYADESADGELIESATVGELAVDDSVSSEISNGNNSEDEVELAGEAPYYPEDFSDEYSEEATAGVLPVESEEISDETEAEELMGDIAIP